MSAERAELRLLVDELPDDQVPWVLAALRRRLVRPQERPWPPAWFGAAVARRCDIAARVSGGLDAAAAR